MINLNSLKPIDNKGEAREFRTSLIDNKWFGKKGDQWFEIEIPKNICNTLHYIFSSKTNDHWEEGTIAKHEKLNRPNYVDKGFWTPFAHGLIFKGVVIKNRIHVDWKDLQNRCAEIYGIRNNKNSKRKLYGYEKPNGV